MKPKMVNLGVMGAMRAGNIFTEMMKEDMPIVVPEETVPTVSDNVQSTVLEDQLRRLDFDKSRTKDVSVVGDDNRRAPMRMLYENIANASGMPLPKFLRNEPPKPMKKCLRHDCNNQTNHNGGYCSAECCKLDNPKKDKKHV